MPKHLLVIRGTEWGRDFEGLMKWRVLDLGQQPWNVLTAQRVAEYPADLTAYQAAVRTFSEFEGARVYMHASEPDSPMRIGPQQIARVMPPAPVCVSSA